MYSTHHYSQVLMTFEFFSKDIPKNENPSSGSRVVPWEQTDMGTDTLS